MRERELLAEDPEHEMVPLNDENPAVPCGLIAKSFFNDQYELYSGSQTDDRTDQANRVTINETDIAWTNDRLYQFKNVELNDEDAALLGVDNTEGDGWKDVQWLDMTDGK